MVHEVIKRMAEINTLLCSIEEYNKSASGELLKRYNVIGKKIQEFFDYLQSACGLAEEKDLYEHVFRSLGAIELLFLPGGLKTSDGSTDVDLLLVCASRSFRTQQKEEKKKFLFLCDTKFIKRIHATGARIPRVLNLGILHHYATTGGKFERPGVGCKLIPVQTEVSEVFETIPSLINDSIQNKDLKVVLRCCAGGQQDHLEFVKPEKMYSIGILLPTMTMIDADLARKMEDRILVKQSVSGLTEIFIPEITSEQQLSELSEKSNIDVALQALEKTRKCISVSDLPQLQLRSNGGLQDSEKSCIKAFSRGVLKALSEENPLYINPFDVCILGDPSSVDCYDKRQRCFAESFRCSLAEWHSPASSRAKGVLTDTVPNLKGRRQSKVGTDVDWPRLGITKQGFKSLFVSANSLKDKMRIHKDTYAAHLLHEIKGPWVAVFKTYYAGYKAYREQMVTEAFEPQELSTIKAIIVTQESHFGEAIPPQTDQVTEAGTSDQVTEAGTSKTNSKLSSAGGGGRGK